MGKKEKFIYQLMLDKEQFRYSSSIANWVFCPYDDVFEITEQERSSAIERLKMLLPEECFVINGDEMKYSGTTKACTEDYCDQLVAHAYDVRFSGFSGAVMTSWQAINTLYFMDDLFFVGFDTTNLLTLPQLLSYLERAGYGETTFYFGSITLVED